MIRVLFLSTDRNIFDTESAVALRMIEYGKVFGELHIVVFSLVSHGFSPVALSDNVFVYPTNSFGKLSFIKDAVRIAKKLLDTIYFGETAISAQDPFETGIAGFLLKRKTHFPLQIQIHTDFYNKEFYDGSLLNWLRFELARFILPRADGVRVVRQKIAQDVVERFHIAKEKVTVLPVFVDIKKIRDYPITINLRVLYPQWEKIILVSSRLSPEKRVDRAIRVVSKVIEKFPNTGLVILGKGSEEDALKRLVQKMKLEKNVVFAGWHDDVSAYYKTASVFLHCSQFEGYGMVLVEAASVGCPIVTTEVGVAQDLLRDGRSALVCPPGDEECLTNKIINLFENPLIEKTLGQEAYRVMDQEISTPEEYIQKYVGAIESLFIK